MLDSKIKSPKDKPVQSGETVRSFTLGTRWMLVLSVIALPVSYLNSLVLGRIAPKALGLYGLLLVSSSITILLVLGGRQTLIKFLPGTPSHRRIPFVLTYGLLVAGLATLFLVAVGVRPSLAPFLARRPLGPSTIRYLFPFVPLVLLVNLFRAILQARMEIKWMTIAGKLIPVISLAGFSILYAFRRQVPNDRLGEVIFFVFCAAQLASLALAAYHVYIRFIRVEPLHLAWYLPSGFWPFSLMVSLSMIVILVLDNFDQALIFSQFKIDQLGIYRASLTTAEFVRWLPLLMIQATLPLFSHLLADEQQSRIKSTYRRVVRYNTLVTTAIALVIVLFSHEILGLFGPEYTPVENVLVLLACAFMFSGISTVNSSFIVASGRVELGLTSGIIGSLLQIVISLILVKYIGIQGVAIGKVINLGCITVLNAWFVNRIAGLKPAPESIKLLGIVILIISLSYFVRPESTVLLFARNILFLSVFAVFTQRWFDYDDYRFLRNFIQGRFER